MPRIPVGPAGSVGIVSDLSPARVPPEGWTSGLNVDFDGAEARRMQDWETVYNITVSSTTATQSLAIEPYFLMDVEASAVHHWIYAGQNKVYVATPNANQTNITRQSATSTASITSTSPDKDYSASLSLRWNGAVLAGVPLLNNGKDYPQYWSPVDTSQRLQELQWDDSAGTKWSTVTAGPVTCAVLRSYREFGVALHTTENNVDFPLRVRWSHQAATGSIPSTWDATRLDKDAGSKDLDETEGHVLDGRPLRGSFVVYKSDACWAMRYVGGAAVMSFDSLFEGTIGLFTTDGVVPFHGKHFLLAQNDIIVHDLVEPINLGKHNKMVRRFFNDVSETYKNLTHVLAYPEDRQIWVVYPSTSATTCDRALVWDWERDLWAIRELPEVNHVAYGFVQPPTVGDTWDTDDGGWDGWNLSWAEGPASPNKRALIAARGPAKALVQMAQGYSWDGTGRTAFLERTHLPIVGIDRQGNPIVDMGAIKQVSALYPQIRAPEGTVFSIRIGAQMFESGAVKWAPAATFTVGTDHRITRIATGRFIAVRIETDAAVDWRLSEYSLEIDVVSRF